MDGFKGDTGQWKIGESSRNNYGVEYYEVNSDNVEGICDVYICELSQEESLANLNLIVAAPELLEALNDMLWEAKNWPDMTMQTMAKAKKAIDKALGI